MEHMKLADNKVLKAWNVEVSKDLLQLQSTRVLAPPKLRYGAGTEVRITINLMSMFNFNANSFNY